MLRFKNNAATRGLMLLGAAPLSFLAATSPAFAQVEAANSAPQNDQNGSDIVVTAQKRSERLSDVPISITALGSTDIAKFGIDDISDLRGLVPGVEIRRSLGLGNPSVTIRGIGVTTFDPVAGNTVATYIDEVPLGSTGQMNFTTFDLERVEVLKGPQGTLFGTGTTAGVIQFVSKRPSDTPEINLRAGAANYGNFFGEAVVGGPVGQDVAARLSVRGETSHGYFHNLATGNDAGGADTIQVRSQLLWQPAGGKVLLKGYYSRADGRSNLYDYIPLLDPNSPATAFCAPIQAGLARGRVLQSDLNLARSTCVDAYSQRSTSTSPFNGYHRSVFGDDPKNVLTNYGFVANASFDLGFATLSSITAFDHTSQDSNDPEGPGLGDRAGAFDVSFQTDINQFSQEIRLNSPAGARHAWVAGATVIKNDTRVRELIQVNFSSFGGPTLSTETPAQTLAGSSPYLEPVTQDAVDIGVFAQVDWRLADRLTLVTGLRASYYKKTFTASLDFPGFSFPEAEESISQSSVSFRAGLNYKIDANALLYASISQGVKPGGYSVQFILNANQLPGAKQERLIAYEAGFKGRLARDLNLNLAGFYYDYHDLQSLTQVLVNGVFTQRFGNIGDARVYGLEGDVNWSPSRALLLRGGATYLDTKITRSVDIDGNGVAGDVTGNKLQSAPTWSANWLGRYTAELSSSADLVLQYDGSYTGANWRSIDNTPFNYTEASTLHNASIALAARDGKWEASAWIRNLTDARVMTWQFNFGGNMRRSYIPPRTFGLTLAYRFK